jgi:hypothetical protein
MNDLRIIQAAEAISSRCNQSYFRIRLEPNRTIIFAAPGPRDTEKANFHPASFSVHQIRIWRRCLGYDHIERDVLKKKR